jgi:hypothetical protein
MIQINGIDDIDHQKYSNLLIFITLQNMRLFPEG